VRAQTLDAATAKVLALLWDFAPAAGDGAAIQDGDLIAQDPERVRSRYIKKNFVMSLTLDEIADVLKP
jgi:hypothetical protein